MCFGVRDALRATHAAAEREPVTVLGQLVHNPAVSAHLETLGVRAAPLDDPAAATTEAVVITAHGTSDTARRDLRARGLRVTDTTCPLVRRAHGALAALVATGHHPVVIGQPGHVEVRGLVGDFPHATVVDSDEAIATIPNTATKIGVVSQTTQPIDRVLGLVAAIRAARPAAETTFRDTVCQPTKDRQAALAQLCADHEVVIVVGGANSNNTRQLVATACALGTTAHHVESPEQLDPRWFRRATSVGITAGTSTLDETVTAVRDAIQRLAH
ncbi:4-hydroxy-3-methylbut-2-enyl diphosphate reductase [soil metagenome]